MGFLIHGIFNTWFSSILTNFHECQDGTSTVKLYFSVPVVLYNCISQNLAKILSTSGKNLTKIWSTSGPNLVNIQPKSGPKSGHTDHVLKIGLYRLMYPDYSLLQPYYCPVLPNNSLPSTVNNSTNGLKNNRIEDVLLKQLGLDSTIVYFQLKTHILCTLYGSI